MARIDPEAQPQKVYLGYESLVRDAIVGTDQGPGTDLVTTSTDDGFEIGAAHMSETCRLGKD